MRWTGKSRIQPFLTNRATYKKKCWSPSSCSVPSKNFPPSAEHCMKMAASKENQYRHQIQAEESREERQLLPPSQLADLFLFKPLNEHYRESQLKTLSPSTTSFDSSKRNWIPLTQHQTLSGMLRGTLRLLWKVSAVPRIPGNELIQRGH